MSERAEDWTALILTGGRSSRLGIDKATAEVGGQPLLARAVAALPATVAVVVAGPHVDGVGLEVTWAVEDEPFGGPVAGIAAGLPHVSSPIVGVLAVDMPLAAGVLTAAVAELSASTNADTVVPVDDGGRFQPLCAAYRTSALSAAIAQLDAAYGASMRALLDGLRVRQLPIPDGGVLVDVDTPEDLDHVRRSVGDIGEEA